MKKILAIFFTIFTAIFVSFTAYLPVFAQAGNLVIDPNTDPRCANQSFAEQHRDICPINLDPINLPFFVSFEFIENFTIFSYLALGLNMLFFGLGMLWVVLVIRAGIDYIRSEGDTGKIEGSMTKIKSVFASISVLFLSVVLIVLVGSFLGLGNFLSWPKKLSQCDDGTLYITKALEEQAKVGEARQISEAEIDAACF